MCYLDYIPFIYHVDNEVTGKYKMDVKSLIQALVIAIGTATGTGLIVMYGTQKTLSVQLDSIKEDVREVKENQKQILKDLYIPQWAKYKG